MEQLKPSIFQKSWTYLAKNNTDMKYLKNILIIILVVDCTILSAQTTDVKAELATAKSSYTSGNLEEARFALERSLNELNNVIAKEIRVLLPDQLGGMPAFNPDDESTGNIGGAGIFVSRTYKEGELREAEVTISDHNPMIAMVNTFLSNSMLTSVVMAESGQKSVKVNGYKGMLQESESDDGGLAFSINIPFGDSLLTLETEGIDSEDDALAMAEEVPIDKMAELVK